MDMGKELSVPGEPFSDWPLALVAMVGGLGGALIGATAGAIPRTVPPVVWVMLSAMLGSGLCALVWCVLEDHIAVEPVE